MKKILYLFAAAVLALSACSKGADKVGGHDNYYTSPGGHYMMHIPADLITSALENLEIACEMGKSEVDWASLLPGMKIEEIEDNMWYLSYNGLFPFDNMSYQTEFTMVAIKLNEDDRYANWDVTINGSRTEREDYRCTFESLGSIIYMAENVTEGWDMLYGRLSMLVFNKDGKKDGCMLTFDGSPSEAQFVRGL